MLCKNKSTMANVCGLTISAIPCSQIKKPPSYDTSWLTSNQTYLEQLESQPVKIFQDAFKTIWSDILVPKLNALKFTAPGGPSTLNNILVNYKLSGLPLNSSICLAVVQGLLCYFNVVVGQFQVWPSSTANTKTLWAVIAGTASVKIDGMYNLPLYRNEQRHFDATFAFSLRVKMTLQCKSNSVYLLDLTFQDPGVVDLDFNLPVPLKIFAGLAKLFAKENVAKIIHDTVLKYLNQAVNSINATLKSQKVFPKNLNLPCSAYNQLLTVAQDGVVAFQYGGTSSGAVPCGPEQCTKGCIAAGAATCCIICSADLAGDNCTMNADIFACYPRLKTLTSGQVGYFIQPAPSNGIVDCPHTNCVKDCMGCTGSARCSGNPKVSSYCIIDPTKVPIPATLTPGPAGPNAIPVNYLKYFDALSESIDVASVLAKTSRRRTVWKVFLWLFAVGFLVVVLLVLWKTRNRY